MPVRWLNDPVNPQPAVGTVQWLTPPPAKPPLPGLGEIATSSLKRGSGEALSRLSTAIPDIASQLLKFGGVAQPPPSPPDPTTLAGRIGAYGKGLVAENPPAFTEPGQFLENPGSFITEAVTESAPQLLPFLINPSLGMAGTALTTYGGVRERQRESGIDEPLTALGAGGLVAALERLGVEKYLPGAGGRIPAGANRLLEAGKGAATGALVEGATEVPQEAIEIAASGDDPLSPEAIKAYGLAATKGAAGGSVVGLTRGLQTRPPPVAAVGQAVSNERQVQQPREVINADQASDRLRSGYDDDGSEIQRSRPDQAQPIVRPQGRSGTDIEGATRPLETRPPVAEIPGQEAEETQQPQDITAERRLDYRLGRVPGETQERRADYRMANMAQSDQFPDAGKKVAPYGKAEPITGELVDTDEQRQAQRDLAYQQAMREMGADDPDASNVRQSQPITPIEGEFRKAGTAEDMRKKVQETRDLLTRLQREADEDLKSNLMRQAVRRQSALGQDQKPQLTQEVTQDAAQETQGQTAPAAAVLDIPQAENLSPEERAAETDLADKIRRDPEAAISWYEKTWGNILNTDNARDYSDRYNASKDSRSTLSAAVHEPASWLVNQMWKRKLAEPGRQNRVLFMAGGTGVGKTKSVEGAGFMQDADFALDANMAEFGKAKRRIDEVLAAGKGANIVYIYREPVAALDQALVRAMKQGRTVPLKEHAKTHIGSSKVFRQLQEVYSGAPNVQFRAIDNSFGKGNAKAVDVDKLPEVEDNVDLLNEKLYERLNQARSEGRISEAVYRGTLGTYQGERGGRQASGPPSQEPEQGSSERLILEGDDQSPDIPTLTETVEERRSAGAAETIDAPGLSESVENVIEGGLEAFRQISRIGAKAVSYLDKPAKYSPTLKKLREDIEHSDLPGKGTGALDFNERTLLGIGEFTRQYEEAKESSAPDKFRSMFDNIRTYANKAGLDLGYVKGYFQRVYDTDKMEKPVVRNDFIKVLEKYGIPQDEGYVIHGNIVGDDGVITTAPTLRKTISRIPPELQRKLGKIPDSELAPFLRGGIDKNGVPQRPDEVVPAYIRGVVRRAEYTRTFGKENEKLDAKILQIKRESNDAGRPLKGDDEQRIRDLAQVLAGEYRRIEGKTARQANDLIVTYQYLRTLPLAVLSSISEIGVAIERGGPMAAAKAFPATLGNIATQAVRIAFKGVPKAQAQKDLEGIALGLDETTAQIMSDQFSSAGVASKTQKLFFKYIGLSPWTRTTQVHAMITADKLIRDNLKALTTRPRKEKTKPDQKDAAWVRRMERELRDMSLDVEKAKAWYAAGAKRDHPYYKRIQAGTLRFVNEDIMHPRGTVKPLAMSNPKLRLIMMLKGYHVQAGNTILKRMGYKLLKGDAVERGRALLGMSIMISTAMLSNILRNFIKYGIAAAAVTFAAGVAKEDKREGQGLWQALTRSGLTGLLQFANDVFNAQRFGSTGLQQIAGPAVSQAQELVEGAKKKSEGKPKKLETEVINAIPGVNLTKGTRDAAKEAIFGR